jgi:hypothetical protein
MTIGTKSILLAAMVLLLLGSSVMLAVNGIFAAQGCLAGGVFAILNFWLWDYGMRRLVNVVVNGGSTASAPAFVLLKMGGLVLSIFGLVATFPLYAVLVGVSVVVAAILLNSMLVGTGHAALEEA